MTSTVPVPRFFGVLVTYRRPDHLRRYLQRLAEQRVRLEALDVVGTVPSALPWGAMARSPGGARETQYLAAPENLGPAGGIALGMQHLVSRAGPDDWVLLFDDDDPPPPGASDLLESLAAFALATVRERPRTGGVGAGGGRLEASSGRLRRVPDDELTGAVPVDDLSGGAFPGYRLQAVQEVGPFQADLFFGFTELHYGLRLQRAGYDLYAHGELWRARRHRRARLADAPGRPGQPSPPWRRYYGVRNLVHILRATGHPLAAARVAVRSGIARPFWGLLAGEAQALEAIRLGVRGALDGWTGRLGRTIAPPVGTPDRAC